MRKYCFGNLCFLHLAPDAKKLLVSAYVQISYDGLLHTVHGQKAP